MARIHLFELQDQSWFPTLLGDGGTAYLTAISRLGGVQDFLAPVVAEALDLSGQEAIIDLCSGAGGPVVDVVELLRKEGREVALTLSDLKPNQTSLTALAKVGVQIHPEPVDASSVPEGLSGLRTLFNAFHHFQDDLALAVLQDAVRSGEPIAIVELSERAAHSVVGSVMIPLFVWLVMLTVRPVRVSWLVLTYLFPILPMTIAWDGFVSHLRTRSPEELDALVAKLDAPGWVWESSHVKVKGPMGYTLLLGLPPTS